MYVTEPEVRSFSRYTIEIGKSRLVTVLPKVVELVENRIAQDLSGTVGVALFDGWTCGTPHYIGVIASYCEKFPILKNGHITKQTSPKMVLLTMSRMGYLDSNELTEFQDIESTCLNAQTQLFFMLDIFLFTGSRSTIGAFV